MRSITLSLLVALAMAVPVGASQDCTPTSSDPEVSHVGFYVDNDPCQPDCRQSVWLYQETNAIDGLQRGDAVKDDTCGGQIESDTVRHHWD